MTFVFFIKKITFYMDNLFYLLNMCHILAYTLLNWPFFLNVMVLFYYLLEFLGVSQKSFTVALRLGNFIQLSWIGRI